MVSGSNVVQLVSPGTPFSSRATQVVTPSEASAVDGFLGVRFPCGVTPLKSHASANKVGGMILLILGVG